jgi:hypothetical protein
MSYLQKYTILPMAIATSLLTVGNASAEQLAVSPSQNSPKVLNTVIFAIGHKPAQAYPKNLYKPASDKEDGLGKLYPSDRDTSYGRDVPKEGYLAPSDKYPTTIRDRADISWNR